MSLAEQLGQAILRLFPFLANDSEQVKDLKAQLAASASQIALMQAAAEADHGQIVILQAKATADASTIAAQAAEIAALKAGTPPVEEPPTSEADSPDGYSVAPDGQTITLGGVRWRIGADKKIYRNDVVQPWSANVAELFLKDGKIWQRVVADWAPNGYFFLAKEGDKGQQNDPRVVIVVPPADTSLPAGFHDFGGVQLQADNWNNPFTPANWWKDKYAFKPENVVVVGTGVELRQNDKGSASIITNGMTSDSAYFEVVVTIDEVRPGLIQAPIYLYENSQGQEIDVEIVGLDGIQLRVHSRGGDESYLKIIPHNPIGKHRYGIKYVGGQYVEWYFDGELVARATKADLVTPLPFPTLPLIMITELWASSGWGGSYTPKDTTMHHHGYKIAA